MVLIIANTNPYVFSDGVKKYIQEQDLVFRNNGIDSLTFFPIIRRFNFGRMMHLWGCVIRMNEKKIYRTLDDEHFKMLVKNYGVQIDTILIHHLKDVNTDVLQQVLSLCRGRVVFYVHDYYSCCTSINLLRNGRCFCGNSILDKKKCSGCEFYEKSLKTKYEIENLLISVKPRLEIIAPSDVAASYWVEAFPQFQKKVRVVGHQIFSGKYQENCENIPENESLRIAFVGAGDYLKGVDYWKNAVTHLAQNKKVSFYHFGRSYWINDNVKQFNVGVNSKKYESMISALRKNKIHVAVLNSFVPETYSYTYYEACASNCYIITNVNSGNIAYEVSKNHNGIVLSNPADLTQCLGNVEKLKNDVNEFRKKKQYGPLIISQNNDSIFPCCIERDLEHTNKSISIKRSFLEFIVDMLYKKNYPTSAING